MTPGAIEIPAGEFKARCLQLMEQVRTTRRPILITKRGKPVAQLVPVDEEDSFALWSHAGTVTVQGDIIGPTGEKWNAEKGILYVGEDED